MTIAVRSVLFEMRHAASFEAAVVAADMAMQADLVSTDELQIYAATLGTWTGIPRARKAIPATDENSWSPQESRLRLLWVFQAGLPRPLCNVPVFDMSGRHVGTPDLLEPHLGVVGEYDGAVHLDRRQRGLDVRREQALRDVDLEYFSVVGADWNDEATLVARMRSACARARRRRSGERRWTIEPPPWWLRTDSVDRRRRLSADERSRLLRSRAG